MNQLFRSAPSTTILLAINIVMFLLTLAMEGQAYDFNYKLGLYYFNSQNFSYFQVITHMFMHGNTVHLLFNMFALLTFGSQLEALWGTKRFLIFYFVTGLGAAFLHQFVQAFEVFQITQMITPATNPSFQIENLSADLLQQLQFNYSVPVVGASGAIFGLLLGFGWLFPNAKLFLIFLPIPIKAKFIIPVLILVELYLGIQNFSADNIAHFAHLGGALFGFILVKLWQPSRQPV